MGRKLAEELQRYRLSLGLISVGFLALGILFIVMREQAVVRIMMIFGIVVAAAGGIALVTYFLRDKKNGGSTAQLLMGIAITVLGLVILINPTAFAEMFPLFLGIFLILMGAVSILLGWAMNLMQENGAKAMLIFGGVLALIGVVLAMNPFRALSWLALLMGILMALAGVLGIGIVVVVSIESKKILRLPEKGSISAEYRDVDRKK